MQSTVDQMLDFSQFRSEQNRLEIIIIHGWERKKDMILNYFHIKSHIIKVALAMVILFVSLCFDTKIEAKVVEQRGNTTCNINNGGILASDKKEIFYFHPGESEQIPGKFEYQVTVAPGIFAMSLEDNSKTRRVTDSMKDELDGNLMNFNIADGWIYYMADQVSKKEDVYITKKVLAKSRADGKGKTQILYKDADNDLEMQGLARFLLVDGYLYYSVNEVENDKIVCNIYRMKLNGKSKVKLAKTINTYFDVKGKWLYYVTYGGSNGDLLKRKNLTQKDTYENIYSPFFTIQDFFIEGKYIFLRAYDRILRIPMKKNASNSEVKTLVTWSTITLERSSLLMVNEGWLYYNLEKEGGRKIDEFGFEAPITTDTLFRMKIDGKQKKKIYDQKDFNFHGIQFLEGYPYSPSSIRSSQPVTRLKIGDIK